MPEPDVRKSDFEDSFAVQYEPADYILEANTMITPAPLNSPLNGPSPQPIHE